MIVYNCNFVLNLILLLVYFFIVLFINAEQEGIEDFYEKISNESSYERLVSICEHGLIDNPSISPEFIFITNKQISLSSTRNIEGYISENNNGSYKRIEERYKINDIIEEFGFRFENITLDELERRGFNREAPITIVAHGYKTRYRTSTLMSAILQSYANYFNFTSSSSTIRLNNLNLNTSHNNRINNKINIRVKHNLFFVNWINIIVDDYIKILSHLTIVANYVTKFINEILIQKAKVKPKQIQLIGHSLGAQMGGFVGKNTMGKLGKIYGLDPAGPCFGSIGGQLFTSSKALKSNDAEEVITIHSNVGFFGIDKPIGKYSIFINEGKIQPGCLYKDNDNSEFDKKPFASTQYANMCSHSRCTKLLFYNWIKWVESENDCQFIAYECKDWKSFIYGFCGICNNSNNNELSLNSVECKRIGFNWQTNDNNNLFKSNVENFKEDSIKNNKDNDNIKQMFIKTTDTPPYCAFQYQIILELNEIFPNNKLPLVSLILHDENLKSTSTRKLIKRYDSFDKSYFGHKLTDKIYTDLLISSRKFDKIYLAILLFDYHLPNGNKILNSIRINYMSNIDPEIRRKFSTKLCLIEKQLNDTVNPLYENRFFFQNCDEKKQIIKNIET